MNRLTRRLLIVFGVLAVAWGAPEPNSFRFLLLGDRTGGARPGIYESVWKAGAAENPAFAITAGDSIEGMNDATAEAEWRQFRKALEPWKQIPLYLAPGNHDIWSEASQDYFRRYAEHPPQYSFDYGPAHFAILDNSRSEALTEGQLDWLATDLRTHAAQPVKFVISHRPSWILDIALGNIAYPLHRLARQYGVQYVIAGHVHQLIHLTLEGIQYLSLPSAGGHLRPGQKHQNGAFFGYTVVDVQKSGAVLKIHELNGRVTSLNDWGAAGLVVQK